MQKNAKVVSFGIFICKNAIKNAKTVISGVFYIKNAKKRRSGIFICKNGKKPDWSELFPRNSLPSSDHRKMLYIGKFFEVQICAGLRFYNFCAIFLMKIGSDL